MDAHGSSFFFLGDFHRVAVYLQADCKRIRACNYSNCFCCTTVSCFQLTVPYSTFKVASNGKNRRWRGSETLDEDPLEAYVISARKVSFFPYVRALKLNNGRNDGPVIYIARAPPVTPAEFIRLIVRVRIRTSRVPRDNLTERGRGRDEINGVRHGWGKPGGRGRGDDGREETDR